MRHEAAIIVGAGPIGLSCAISAKRRGIDPLVIDAGAVANSIVRYPINMTFFTTPERLEIGNHPLVCAGAKPTREEALKYYRGVVRVEGIRVQTYTKLVDAHEVETRLGREPISCDKLVLATGYFDHVTGGLYSENLAAAPDGRASASAVVSAWMQSDHHRANILFPDFREVGVGATVTGPDPAFYQDYPSVVYATDFGRRYYRGPAPACNRSRSAPGLPHRVCQRRRTHHRRRRHRVSRS